MSEFEDIMNGLDLPDPEDVTDVTKLDTVELLVLIDDLEKELIEMGELLHPHTQVARDKHSLRNAAGVERSKRMGF